MTMRVPGWPDPVDPWPNAPTVPFGLHDGHTSPIGYVAPAVRKGAIFGYVYELVLVGQRTDETSYVGKTEGGTLADVADRANEHRREVDRFPWKAGILPGKAGYRVLERVRCTGDGYEADRRALLRAEADWIDRRRPVHNGPRPVRPRHGEALPSAPKSPRPVVSRPPTARELADRRARCRGWAFVVLALVATGLSAYMLTRTSWTGAEWGPWVFSPVLGVGGTLWAWHKTTAAARRITRGTRRRR
jgi:hypothetical protein